MKHKSVVFLIFIFFGLALLFSRWPIPILALEGERQDFTPMEKTLPRFVRRTLTGQTMKRLASVISEPFRTDTFQERETLTSNVKTAPTREEVFRTVPLKSLPISKEFLRELEAETKDPGNMALDSPGGVSGSYVGIRPTLINKDEENKNKLPPFSYRVVSFTSGTTRSGNLIRPTFDLGDLDKRLIGPPDYSLTTKTPALDRLLSLGNKGEVIFEVVGGELIDGPGPDLLIFENPFIINGTEGKEVYAETAFVAVAEINDPNAYREFLCQKNEKPYRGCAGVVPVRYSSSRSLIEVGGDRFDLSDIGLQKARFIRVTDTGDNSNSFVEGTEGADMDAIALVNSSRR